MLPQISADNTPLFEQLKELIESGEPAATLLVEQLKKEAQKYLKSSPLEGYIALGIVASLQHDVEGVHTYYQQAIHLAAHNSIIITLANYSFSLAQLGYFSEAADLISQAFKLSGNYLDEAIYLCCIAGRFQQVDKLTQSKEKLKNPLKIQKLQELAKETQLFMEEKGIDDQQLETLINIALSVLRNHQIYTTPEQIQMCLFTESGKKWFHYGILVRSTLEKTFELGFELTEKIAQSHLTKETRDYFIPMFEAVGK